MQPPDRDGEKLRVLMFFFFFLLCSRTGWQGVELSALKLKMTKYDKVNQVS